MDRTSLPAWPPSLTCPWAWLAWGGEGCCPHLSPIPAGTLPHWYLYRGSGRHDRVVGWKVVGQGYLGEGLWHFGGSDATPVSGKGRRPPSHPDLPLCSGSCMQCTDGKLRHGERGHYSAHVPVAPTSPCQTCLILPACPSPRRVPHPDSHARGHGQLSTSFQAGTRVSAGGGGQPRAARPSSPRKGWGTPLPNPPLSGPQAAKPLSVPPRGCPPSLRPPAWRIDVS